MRYSDTEVCKSGFDCTNLTSNLLELGIGYKESPGDANMKSPGKFLIFLEGPFRVTDETEF